VTCQAGKKILLWQYFIQLEENSANLALSSMASVDACEVFHIGVTICDSVLSSANNEMRVFFPGLYHPGVICG
jgi:hypothetical protein